MQGMIFNLAVEMGVLALVAWACMHASRPFFKSKSTRVVSQTIASLLLLLSFGLSKALQNSNGASTEDLVGFIILFLAIKSAAMYLIGCYAKSVGKSPYWSFIGLLNFGLAIIVMAIGLWRDQASKDQNPIDG